MPGQGHCIRNSWVTLTGSLLTKRNHVPIAIGTYIDRNIVGKQEMKITLLVSGTTDSKIVNKTICLIATTT